MRSTTAAVLLAAVALTTERAEAQRGVCRDCDTARVASPARDRALGDQLARLGAEIQRLRAELARTRSADSASARALRTTIESLLLSQRYLEEAMREHDVLVRTRQAQGLEATTRVFSGARAFQQVPSGYLGVTTEARYTFDEAAGQVRRTTEFPVVITVAPGSPAHSAGLTAGDVVLAVDELDGRLLEQRLAPKLQPGETLRFRVRRDGEERVVAVRVAPVPPGAVTAGAVGGARASSFVRVETGGSDAERELVATTVRGQRVAPAIGATVVPLGEGSGRGASTVYLYREPPAIAGARLAPLSGELAAKLGVAQGLLVLMVAPNTPGARAGLLAGDAIIGTSEGPLSSVPQLYEMMSASTTGTLTLRVVRDREPRLLTVRW